MTSPSILARGAAAALLLAGAAAISGAQVVAGTMRPRDSLYVFRQGEPMKIRVDSVMVLFNALEREPFGTPGWRMLRAKIDSLMPTMARIRVVPPPEALPKGWIGINAGGVPRHEEISDAGDVVRYFAYPSIVSVDPESPAQRAGIEPGDILLAYNGIDVVGHDVNLTQLFVPEKRMLVTVRRGDETKEYPVLIGKMPEHVFQRRMNLNIGPRAGEERIARATPDDEREPMEMPKAMIMPGFGKIVTMSPNGMYVYAPDGIFGARVSTVGPDLAKVLKLEPGMLVNDVADESIAARSGLRAGDVITGAAGQSVTSLSELQRAIATHLNDRAVELQIVRERKARKLTVKW